MENTDDFKFTETELFNILNKEQVNLLQKEGLLERSAPLSEIFCLECSEHIIEPIIEKGRAYAVCHKEDIGYIDIPLGDLNTWVFNIKKYNNFIKNGGRNKSSKIYKTAENLINDRRKFYLSKVISSIVYVKDEEKNKALIVINGSYDKVFSVGIGTAGYWDNFFKIVEGQTLDISINKGLKDYFNSNIKNPIYSKHGFYKTQIIGERRGKLYFLIPVELITEQTFKTRLRKLKN